MPLQSTYHVFIVFQSLKAQARFHFNHRNHFKSHRDILTYLLIIFCNNIVSFLRTSRLTYDVHIDVNQ